MNTDNTVVHIDFTTKDAATSGKFYADVFGWTIKREESFDYTMFQPPAGPGGGFVNIDKDRTYNEGDVIVYIEVPDLDATAAKITSLGGKIVQPKMEIPGVGWFAFFTDPSNTRVGLIQSLPR